HNGSVPTLRALLYPDERPAAFYRAYDVYDWERVGFTAEGPEAEAHGVRFDTALRGNGNAGHTYGRDLRPADRDAIIEYLKTRWRAHGIRSHLPAARLQEPHDQEPRVPVERVRAVRQLRRLGQSGAHQLGNEVCARRRRR